MAAVVDTDLVAVVALGQAAVVEVRSDPAAVVAEEAEVEAVVESHAS